MKGNRGLITRNVEAHRSGFGLIEIETASLPAENIRTLQSLGCTKPTSSASKASTEPSFQSIPFRLADVNSQQKGFQNLKFLFHIYYKIQPKQEGGSIRETTLSLASLKSERILPFFKRLIYDFYNPKANAQWPTRFSEC